MALTVQNFKKIMQECAKHTHVITQVQLVCQPSMVHDLRDLKPHRLRPQRCQKTPQSSFKNFSIYSLPSPSPSLAVLVNRSLSDMQGGSQRCQHLQCLDRPLKPDPRTHTHTTHSACPLRQHTWWDGMPTAIRLGKYPSENQTIAIIPLITSQLHTHTHLQRAEKSTVYDLWKENTKMRQAEKCYGLFW